MALLNYPDQHLKKYFPQLSSSNSRPTSDKTAHYNCIAWAYGIDNMWFWPDSDHQYYWPDNIRRAEDIDAFIDLFRLQNYIVCESDIYEDGFQKIALYVKDNKPTHAARQLSNGKWTSKLGVDIDIEHDTPECLNGSAYGTVAIIMKRPIA